MQIGPHSNVDTRALVPTFKIRNVANTKIEDGGATVRLLLHDDTGDSCALIADADALESVITAFTLARDAARKMREPGAITRYATVPANWEVGIHPQFLGLILTFDKAAPNQTMFAIKPVPARAIGKSLIEVARKAEQKASQAVNNQ